MFKFVNAWEIVPLGLCRLLQNSKTTQDRARSQLSCDAYWTCLFGTLCVRLQTTPGSVQGKSECMFVSVESGRPMADMTAHSLYSIGGRQQQP